MRIRPEQLVASSELLATLEYRTALFEVVVSAPLSAAVLKARSLPVFKTVFVPSRAFDPTLLYDSLPFSWRTSLEVMAPLPAVFDDAMSADELFLWMSRRQFPTVRPLHPYADFSRSARNHVPGHLADIAVTGAADRDATAIDIRLSVALAVSASSVARMLAQLEPLIAQALERTTFEIVIACDRVSDDVIESLMRWSRERADLFVQILRLPDCWGNTGLRLSEAFNLAALAARGSRLMFLSPAFPVNHDLLSRCSQITAPIAVLTVAGSTDRAMVMTSRHYFEIAGFSESQQQSGFEFEFALWKSARIGRERDVLILPAADSTPRPSQTKLKRTRRFALSAQDFYFSTLDPDVYTSHYVLMGDHRVLRRLFRAGTRTQVFQKTFLGVSLIASFFARVLRIRQSRFAMRAPLRPS